MRSALALLLALPAFAAPKPYSPYSKLDLLARAMAHIENSYVDAPDERALVYGAIRGMVATLDPHSEFLTPEAYKAMKGESEGEFAGIGLEVEMRAGVLTVVAPMEDTPASRAGLASGDRILQVDGKPMAGLDLDAAVARMRGPAGSTVTLEVARDGWPAPREIPLKRELIQDIPVDGRLLAPGFALVRIRHFQQDRTDRRAEDLIDAFAKRSGGALRGLVLDLRNDPGGLFEQGVRVADLFLDKGLIVRTLGRDGRVIEEEQAHVRGSYMDFPIVALVNAGTASAAEIVAGALQDQGRAVIVGTQTFGKGSVQTIVELGDGSALKLTTARYVTPSGRSLQERGITPDIVVEATAPAPAAATVPQRERDLERHLRAPSDPSDPVPDGPANDPQLRAALDTLRTLARLRAQAAAKPGR